MRANGTAAAVPSKDLVKEINALNAQLKRVSQALAAEASTGVNRALDAVESKGKEAVDDAIGAAQQFVDDYADNAKDAAANLARKSAQIRDNAADSLIETVQARPFGTLAAVLGIGFLAGYLCRRG
jgi:ElaB/YqjD/DUF883 family membrane-anchored ribosome-binding protein